jgi:hypothetical protein
MGLVVALAASLGPVSKDNGAQAEDPSPATYYGMVLVNGVVPATGAAIIAETADGDICGLGDVWANGTSAFYMIKVYPKALASSCFEAGDPIVFKFNGMKAQELPQFHGSNAYQDLHFKATRLFPCSPPICPLSSQPVFVLPPGAR